MAMKERKKPLEFTKEWYFDKKESGKTDINIAYELDVCGVVLSKWKKELGINPGKYRKQTLWDQYKDKALVNGVTYAMFGKRIREGKTPEQAIKQGRIKSGRPEKKEKDEELEYDQFNRIKYNPEFHENHRKPFEEEDFIYMCQNYGSKSCRDIAFALGRTEATIYRLVSVLRKNGKFDYYKSLDY